ncbi:MAG: hypothetical protein Q4F70_02550 [Clostridia bacterium]|nr:hypothetical protein [Clostridia bacterium]
MAILIFVMLGVALYLGIGWSGGAVEATVEKDYKTFSMHDLEVIYPYGFSDEDIEKIAKIDGVDYVKGINFYFQFFDNHGVYNQAKVITITDDIDKLNLIEGKLPTKAGEAALEKKYADENGYKIGDVIEFKHDASADTYNLNDVLAGDLDALAEPQEDEDGMQVLTTDKVKVTALVESTVYSCIYPITYGSALDNAAPINTIIFVPEETFDKDAFTGYIDLLIASDELAKYTNESNEYKTASDALKKRVEAVTDKMAADKNEEILAAGDKLVDKLNERLADAEAQIEDGKAQLEAAKAEIEANKELLRQKEAELEDARKQVADGERRLAEAKEELKTAEDAFALVQEIYDLFESIYDIGKDVADEVYALVEKAYNNGLLDRLKSLINKYLPSDSIAVELYNEFYQNFVSGYYKEHKYEMIPILSRLHELLSQYYNDALAALNDARAQIADGEAQIAAGKKAIEEGTKAISDGWAQIRYAEGVLIPKYEAELQAAIDEYEKGKVKLGDLKTATGNIVAYDAAAMARDYNGGLVVCNSVKNVFDKMRYTMAALFIIVGLLVCYSAVSRMVYEKTVLIGTKKALGLFDREIKASELGFTLVAAIVGAILGVLLGRFALETFFMYIISDQFTFADTVYYASFKDALIIIGIELVTIVVTTLFACNKVLKKSAVKLLQGAEPPKAKERFFEKTKLWNRLPLLTKTIINNCLNDKRRCFGTIVGVTGCVALVVCSLTFYDGINNSIKRQFGSLTTFDTIIYVDDSNEEYVENITSILDKNEIEYSSIYFQPGSIHLPNDRQIVAELMVPLDDSFYDNIHMINNDGEEKKIESGAWVCRSYSYFFDTKPGDKVEFVDGAGTIHAFDIEDTAEYYNLRVAAFASKDAFEQAYGYSAKTNALVLSKGDLSIADLTGLLKDEDGFMTIQNYYYDSKINYDVNILVAKAIVAVYMILSVVMAFLVLLNLFSMFVSEKKKELIVLMINGFYEKDAKKYIYLDTIVLTIIGMIFGVALGALAGYKTIQTLITEASYFMLTPDPIAMIAGVVVTAVLVVITTLIALKRVSSFKLTDINSDK